jgi:hypothetical protein
MARENLKTGNTRAYRKPFHRFRQEQAVPIFISPLNIKTVSDSEASNFSL